MSTHHRKVLQKFTNHKTRTESACPIKNIYTEFGRGEFYQKNKDARKRSHDDNGNDSIRSSISDSFLRALRLNERRRNLRLKTCTVQIASNFAYIWFHVELNVHRCRGFETDKGCSFENSNCVSDAAQDLTKEMRKQEAQPRLTYRTEKHENMNVEHVLPLMSRTPGYTDESS